MNFDSAGSCDGCLVSLILVCGLRGRWVVIVWVCGV